MHVAPMLGTATIRPVSEANCPLRRAIMAEPPAPPASHFGLQMLVLSGSVGLGTILVLENWATINYLWLLIMELCA